MNRAEAIRRLLCKMKVMCNDCQLYKDSKVEDCLKCPWHVLTNLMLKELEE